MLVFSKEETPVVSMSTRSAYSIKNARSACDIAAPHYSSQSFAVPPASSLLLVPMSYLRGTSESRRSLYPVVRMDLGGRIGYSFICRRGTDSVELVSCVVSDRLFWSSHFAFRAFSFSAFLFSLFPSTSSVFGITYRRKKLEAFPTIDHQERTNNSYKKLKD